MHVNTGHHNLREWIPSASGGSAQTQRERPNSVGAPKLNPIEWISWPSLVRNAQTRRERPNSAIVHLWETLTAKLCCLEGLAILASKALCFVGRHFQLYDTSPTIPKWPWAWLCWNCTGSYKFSVSVKKMGEWWTGEASDIVKAKYTGEDPRATLGLVSSLPHPLVNQTKQHTNKQPTGTDCCRSSARQLAAADRSMGFAMNELSEVVSRSQICSRVLQCVEVRCSVLQRVAVRCSVSQCDAVCCADYLLYRALILQTEESAAFKYVAVRCSAL